MDLFRLFRRGRRAERRGQPPVVEAALRAKRARDHLARKRRRGERSGERAAAPVELEREALHLDPIDLLGPLAADRPAEPDAAPARPHPAAVSGSRRPSATARAGSARVAAARAGAARAATSPRTRRSSVSTRAVIPAAPPMPRFVVPAATLLALGAGYAASGPLFVRVWLPRVPLARVAVAGTSVRQPVDVARALWPSAGAPLDRVDADYVRARVGEDPWIESAESFRLPTGTLVVRVRERRAIARYRSGPDGEVTLLDPAGRPFAGEVAAAGRLPLVEGPIDGEAALSATGLEILEELARHAALAGDPTRLTLHLPGSAGLAAPIRLNAVDVEATVPMAGVARSEDVTDPGVVLESLEGESGYVLAIGETGPRALLGQSFLKRRIARLALLLDERDALLASARVIDLRFADRAVLRTGPTSG